MNEDLEHLKYLSYGHYALAALVALGTCFPLLYAGIGFAGLMGRFDSSDPMPAPVGLIFLTMGLVGFAMVLAYAGALLLAGRFLVRQEHYLFCLVLAALSTTFAPFGTVLGIFTLIVLLRDSVKERFAASATAAAGG